ncbi:MAG: hypothetical protein MJZ19_08520 [Paludibacteraceae bacterium]|nr:hypothetical protein [Paludibacteraceae bacterium]
MTNEEILQIFDEEKTPYWCLLHKKSKGTLGECGKQGGKEDRTLGASRSKLANKLSQYQSYPCIVYFFDTKEELLDGLKNKDLEKMPCIAFAENTVVKPNIADAPSISGISSAPFVSEEDIEKRANDKFSTFRLEFELNHLKKDNSDLRDENRYLKQKVAELEREIEKNSSNTINSFVGAVSPFLPMIQKAFGGAPSGAINGLPQIKTKRTMKETIVKRMPADELALLDEIKRIEPEAWKTLLANIVRLHDEDKTTYDMARKFLM